jgi:hypothetical protein
MRRALHKILTFVLATGLAVGGPICSHAQMGTSAAATLHETHAVPHYADLSIDPEEDGCSHASSGTSHSHDDGLCKKCCAACVGASLVPTAPIALTKLSASCELMLTLDDNLVARAVPTEPGIPKPL